MRYSMDATPSLALYRKKTGPESIPARTWYSLAYSQIQRLENWNRLRAPG